MIFLDKKQVWVSRGFSEPCTSWRVRPATLATLPFLDKEDIVSVTAIGSAHYFITRK